MITDDNAVQLLARYAPTPESVAGEWSSDRMQAMRRAIVGDASPAADAPVAGPIHDIQLRFRPTPHLRTRRRAGALTGAAVVAVLAAVAAIVVAIGPFSGGGSGAPPAGGVGPVFDPPVGLSAATIGAHQYAYRVVQQIDLDAHGRPIPHGQDAMIMRTWLAPNGDSVDIRTGSQNGCFVHKHSAPATFDRPTSAFFASLPTGVDALYLYLRKHVEGSSSRDEAVFVAVGDMLRTADGLTSARLRATFLAVLSRTPGVFVHEGQRDYLGRPAIRADFADQRIRPGEVQSLYFDPRTFRLLGHRDGSNGQPTTAPGPSPAYDAPAGPGVSPEQLTGTAYVEVMTKEQVVAKLPKLPSGCHHD